MRLQALHCPSCGAPVEVAPDVTRLTCQWCSGSLVVEHEQERVTHRAPQRPAHSTPETAPYPQPDATLFTRETRRFELSMIEQKVAERPADTFVSIELSEERFALVYLRAVDEEGAPAQVELAVGFQALRESLESDADPGLGANLALEALCARGFAQRLECAVLLFEPKHMQVSAYNAGCANSVLWVSSEEARTIIPHGDHRLPLERKMLREARDNFSNASPIQLAANDLVVLVSAGYAGRGDRAADSARPLLDALNANLGEEPLKIVALAKNAFWASRRGERAAEPPAGSIGVAAVRSLLPTPVERLPSELHIQILETPKFELALMCGPRDVLRLLPLHAKRQVAVWLSPREGTIEPAQFEQACQAVLAILDRPQHGDNENPRLAGRNAYAALGRTPDQVQMAVIQLFDQYQRVKYFRGGWKQPLMLGERGVRADEQQQFDEGGEATVRAGSRLFFPGLLDYDGQCLHAAALSEVWPGGKASLLFEALAGHWKTKKSDKALEKLARAALGDVPGAALGGLGIVTGR